MNNLITTNNGIYYISGNPVKIGIVAKTANHIDYSRDLPGIRSDEKSLLTGITGIPEKDIIFLDQVHGDEIVIIRKPPEENRACYAAADGMITNISRICLVIRTADCVPVIIFDYKKNIVGAVHSGWKGCQLDVSGKAVRKMNQIYGSDYKDIRVFILPSIGPSSYEVNNDVASLFERGVSLKNNKIYLDLWFNIESSLIDEGIPSVNIYNTRICTLRNSGDFFSHRNNDLSRNLNFVYIN